MNKFNIGDVVALHSTSDLELDRATGTVEGFHDKDGVIVTFLPPRPLGYNPAIVITQYCIKKV